MTSCFLEVLRCILFCGEEEEETVPYSYRTRGDYAALVTKSPEKPREGYRLQRFPQHHHLKASPSPLPHSSNASSSTPLPSNTSLSSLPSSKTSQSSSLSSKASPTPFSSSNAFPSTPLPSNTSLSSLPSSKTSQSSSLSSKASPSPFSSSNASPSTPLPSNTYLSSLPSSKASHSSSLSSKASPSPFSSSKASPSLPPPPKSSPSTPPPLNASPDFVPAPKASPTLFSSPKPSKSVKRTPELPQIKHPATVPRYEIPKDLQDMIKRDMVPAVLRRPLSPSTYADYFATLLYAEDFYIEKWSKFLLSEVTLELRKRAAFENSRETKKMNETILRDRNDFVAFEIDAIPEKRPYLLSRDFVFVRPSGKKTEPFKGVLFRVVKSTMILVEFGDDFHSQHSPSKKYDVSFSFNRVCLKRSHQAISAAKDPSLHSILFPNPSSSSGSLISKPNVIHPHRNLNQGQLSVASRILNHKGPLPYLLEGPPSSTPEELSATGAIIQQAILKIYRTAAHCRILICAPTNRTCDALMRSLYKEIPRSMLFRANAAFRDYDLVPGDIIPECLYEGECFTCPPLCELQIFRVITSTFVSSFRLQSAGVDADHFTHIFLVDASLATEPEAVVALANLVGKNTVLMVTGSSRNFPRWVRSDIARRHGLRRSYFQRLLEREPYLSNDPMFITHVE